MSHGALRIDGRQPLLTESAFVEAFDRATNTGSSAAHQKRLSNCLVRLRLSQREPHVVTVVGHRPSAELNHDLPVGQVPRSGVTADPSI